MIFTDRIHAGRELAAALADYSIREEVLNDRVVVLALPRGGVPVAAEIADKLALPLDLLLVRKLGVPGHEEYAMAISAADSGVLLTTLGGLSSGVVLLGPPP